jgi:hypothetical protein
MCARPDSNIYSQVLRGFPCPLPITKIINMSLSTGRVPQSCFKGCSYNSHSKEQLTKNSYVIIVLSQSFLFYRKHLSGLLLWKLNSYLNTNDLLSLMQSAYPRHHIVETTIVRVCSDLLLSLDRGTEMVQLVLLDYILSCL